MQQAPYEPLFSESAGLPAAYELANPQRHGCLENGGARCERCRALLHLEATKYLEGISGPPSLRLLQLTEELRRTSNRALAATIGLLMSFEPG
jgi:hypothetical protein